MAEIKTNKKHLERWIKIKRQPFDVLLTTRAVWLHLNSPSEIQWPRLNHNDSQSRVLLELLIKD